MKNRCKSEIIKLILEAAMIGATKTKIMDIANLPSKQAEIYLIMLMGQKLLREKGQRFYKITENGIKFLRKTSELNELLLQ